MNLMYVCMPSCRCVDVVTPACTCLLCIVQQKMEFVFALLIRWSWARQAPRPEGEAQGYPPPWAGAGPALGWWVGCKKNYVGGGILSYQTSSMQPGKARLVDTDQAAPKAR